MTVELSRYSSCFYGQGEMTRLSLRSQVIVLDQQWSTKFIEREIQNNLGYTILTKLSRVIQN